MIAAQPSPSTDTDVKYPGIPEAMDGTAAVVAMETAASTAGLAMVVGLRSANSSSGQDIASMHESLYAATGKRPTYVLNTACPAMTHHALNAGHADHHAIDDTGFFQLFAKNAQEAADLNLVAHRVAELALTPGVCALDGFPTSRVIESIRLPERELVREYLGDPADLIESPTPAQKLVFGETRRRIPVSLDPDQGATAQRPFFFDHVAELADRAFAEYAALTGRWYQRASGYQTDDAEWVIVGRGSVVADAEAVADHLRTTRGLRVGVLNVTMSRPFPSDLISRLLRGKPAAFVLECVDQPMAADAPLLREIRGAMAKAVENGACDAGEVPDFYSGCFGPDSRELPGAAGHRGAEVVEDDLRVIRHGFDEVRELDRAGRLAADRMHHRVETPLEREYEAKLAALREEYERKIAELKTSYPEKITRRIAEALVSGEGGLMVVPAAMDATPSAAEPVPAAATPALEPSPVVEEPPPVGVVSPPIPPDEAVPAAAEEADDDEDEGIEPYIDTDLCTTCNECTNLNPRMFAYNDDKKAYIKDPRAGTFAQLVQAAERCTARIIHPGTPLDPDEPDLETWIERAEPFN